MDQKPLVALLHGRRFVAVDNAGGLSGPQTVFTYEVTGDVVKGTYAGGAIAEGTLLGKVLGPDRISLVYHCVTVDGLLKAGWSEGVVAVNHKGIVSLTFEWGWMTKGAESSETSSYAELKS